MTPVPGARKGRPPVLTEGDIGRAVLEVGFPALTFAAVRERLGVGQTTLYRHARDRDELVRIGLDHVIAHAEWPSLDGPWREVIRRFAFAIWHAFAAHPGSATESARGVMPLGVMRLMDDLCAMLMRAGFTVDHAVLACDVVFDMVTDNRRGVEHLDQADAEPAPRREQWQQAWGEASAAVAVEGAATADERRRIHGAMHGAITAEPLEWFSRKLEVVLDGVQARLAP